MLTPVDGGGAVTVFLGIVVMNGSWLGEHERGDSLVKSSGVGRRYLILLGVERIAQRELNVSFRTGEGQALGIVGRNQKGDHGRVLGLAGGGSLQRMAGSKHGDILQNGRGLLFARLRQEFRSAGRRRGYRG